MKRVFVFLILFMLVSCKKDESREVVLAESPDGRTFHFMPVYEKGVTDITITIAWPMQWAYRAGSNPAVPYIAADAILSGGTDDLAAPDVLELFSDKNSSGHLYVRANHAVGELSFPKEHVDDIVPIASKLLASANYDPTWINRIKRGFLANQKEVQAFTVNQMWGAAMSLIHI